MQRKKTKVKTAVFIGCFLVFIAIIAGSLYIQHKAADTETGTISEINKEEVRQTIRDTAWMEEHGEYKNVYVFCMESDCWHGETYDAAMKGCWGTYEITGDDTFRVDGYPGSYCDFAGTHTYRISDDKKSIEIDGLTYKKTNLDDWLSYAYADDVVPENAITEGEDE